MHGLNDENFPKLPGLTKSTVQSSISKKEEAVADANTSLTAIKSNRSLLDIPPTLESLYCFTVFVKGVRE